MAYASAKTATRLQLKALADETRLKIIALLDEECCVCELMDELDVAQPLLSFHLRVLKEAGLVRDRREGRWSYYTLNRDELRALGEFLQGLGGLREGRRRRDC